MTVTDQMKQSVEAFFIRLAAVPDSYRNSVFSYVAAKKGDQLILLGGAVMLGTDPSVELLPTYSTARVAAGQIKLDTLGRLPRDFVDDIFTGSLTVDGCAMIFPAPEAPGSYAVWPIIAPEPQWGTPFWRHEVLRIVGGQRDDVFRHPDFSWELRRSHQTFDDLNELAQAYGLDGLNPAYTIEIVSPHLAEIDSTSSATKGSADLVIRLTPNVPREPLLITYRAYREGVVAERGPVSAEAISWTENSRVQIGRVRLTAPEPVMLQAYVSYGEIGQHTTWIVDRTTVHNELRHLYELADPDLKALRKFLFEEVSGKHQKQLEATIGCLTWMMGFRPGHVGGVPEATEFADLILTTDSGQIVVLECTSGPLKAQNKLSNLNGRRNRVRDTMTEIDPNRHVLGCILTTLSRSEISADLEQASGLGLLVVTVDDFEEWIEQTRIPQSAEVMFAAMEAKLQDQIATFKATRNDFPGMGSTGI